MNEAYIILEAALGSDRFQRMYPDNKPYIREVAWKLSKPAAKRATTEDITEAGRRLVRHVQKCNQYDLQQISIHTLTDIIANIVEVREAQEETIDLPAESIPGFADAVSQISKIRESLFP